MRLLPLSECDTLYYEYKVAVCNVHIESAVAYDNSGIMSQLYGPLLFLVSSRKNEIFLYLLII